MNKRNVLASLLLQLEDDAVEILLMQAQRMVAGRATYGELRLDTDKRDWVEEALQESIDATSYLNAALIRLRRR